MGSHIEVRLKYKSTSMFFIVLRRLRANILVHYGSFNVILSEIALACLIADPVNYILFYI